MPRQILAIGGMGFDSDCPTPQLDRYFLDLTGKSRPKLCLIPTASGDSLLRIARFNRAATEQDCETTTIELFRMTGENLRDKVMSQDAIYVSGGNTYNMLHLWKLWGLTEILREAYEAGIVLGGVSAGANCWFEDCSTDSFGGPLGVMDCLGWLKGSFCPHLDSEPERRPKMMEFFAESKIREGYAADEMTGLLFQDEVYKESVSDNVNNRTWRTSKDGFKELLTRVL